MADYQDVLGPDNGRGTNVDNGDDQMAWGGYRDHWKFTPDPDGSGVQGDGYFIPNGTYSKDRTSAREDDVNRYRQMGADQANRAAPTADYWDAQTDRMSAQSDRANAGDARLAQQDALAQMQSAAYGNAPSKAELLGRQMADQSLDAQMAAAASARGGALNQASAMRNAQMGAAQFQQQNTNQMAALRADEMARARDAYMGGASTIRGQDYQGAAQAADMMSRDAQMAQYQADLEMRQRMLNQQGQQFNEQLGWNTNNAAMQANLQKHAMDLGQYQFTAGQQERADARDQQFWGSMIGAGASAMMMMSDERSKRGVVPLARSQSMGTMAPWMPPHDNSSAYLLTSDAKSKDEQRLLGQAEGMQAALDAQLQQPPAVQGALDRERAKDEEAAREAASYSDKPGGSVKDNPYATGPGSYTGGLVRENPYGEDGGIIRENPYGQAPAAGQGQAQADPSGKGPNWAGALGALGKGIGGAMQSSASNVPPQQYSVYGIGYQPSDERSKEDVVPLTDLPGRSLRMGDNGRAYYAADGENPVTAATGGASLSGGRPASPQRSPALAKTKAARQRPMSADELSALADREIARTRAMTAAVDQGSPTVGGTLVTSDEAAKRNAYLLGRMHQSVRDKGGDDAWAYGTHPTLEGDHQEVDEDPADVRIRNRRVRGGGATSLEVTKSVPGKEVSKPTPTPAKPPAKAPAKPPAGKKTAAVDPSEAEPAQMMDAIGPGIAYRYKDGIGIGQDPDKQHFGTTTQALRSTPMGASMVVPTTSGYDAIDTREAVGPTLASLGNLNQRLRRLEGESEEEGAYG